jgi:hypothetical protein
MELLLEVRANEVFVVSDLLVELGDAVELEQGHFVAESLTHLEVAIV